MRTEQDNMPTNQNILPEIIVFAGPNGSGKTTITKLARIIEPYINADDIKKTLNCSDIDAAVKAEELREYNLKCGNSFTFETVFSTDRNLHLLQRAKANGYFIRCIYILTKDPSINVIRVKTREANGGHGVPKDKIISRYAKCLDLIPSLVKVCDIMHIYDNSKNPFRIFKKRKEQMFFWANEFWSEDKIKRLVGVSL